MTNQEQLLKQLITTFFVDFIDLFFPKVAVAIAPQSVKLLTPPAIEPPGSCLLFQAQLRTQATCFWIQLQGPSSTGITLERLMFHRYAQLDATYNLPIYPIVIFPGDLPDHTNNLHRVEFLDRKILDFTFVTLKLKQLNWRDYLKQRNPVAAGLMATMNVQPSDCSVVKAECLRLLAKLKLDFQRLQVVSNLIHGYLPLDPTTEQTFQQQIERMGLLEREQVMEILARSGPPTPAPPTKATALILRLLNRQVGGLNPELEAQIQTLPASKIETLGDVLLDFQSLEDLERWLAETTPL